MEFLLATACVFGKVQLKHFSEEVLTDKRVRELSQRINVLADDRMVPSSGKVAIELTDNNTYSRVVEKPKGHSRDPLSLEEIEEKFRACAGLFLPEDVTEKALSMIMRVEDLEDIGSLVATLRATPAA
jgi:2-methylcitrate dehydratase PrpD